MPFKMYLDGSETPGVVMTLGSIVAEESVWSQLEPAWNETLLRHGAPYSHMKELTGGIDAFDGWDLPRRQALLSGLVATLEKFGPSDKIRQYGCWADLAAYERWASARALPTPQRLCTRVLFGTFLHDYPGLLDTLDVWFDQNERFMTHLREDWENPKMRRASPVWGLVRTIASADMTKVPPLQVADLIAWSRNRMVAMQPKLAALPGVDFFTIAAARVLNHGIRGLHREAGEEAMAQGNFPEEGLRRIAAIRALEEAQHLASGCLSLRAESEGDRRTTELTQP